MALRTRRTPGAPDDQSGLPPIRVLSDQMITDRDRGKRRREGLTILSTSVAVPALLGWFIGARLGFPQIGFAVGAGLGVKLSSMAAYWVLIITDQMQAVVTTDTLDRSDNPNKKYGPGMLTFKRFSETVSVGSNVPLVVITASFGELVPGADAQLKVVGSYQYRVRPETAEMFVGIDESTISGGLGDLVLSRVSSVLANKKLDEAKAELPLYNAHLSHIIGGHDYADPEPEAGTVPPATTPSNPPQVPITEEERRDARNRITEIEALYGIEIVTVTITGIDSTEEVQRARDVQDRVRHIFTAVAQLLMNGTAEELRQAIKDKVFNPQQVQDARREVLALLGTGTITTTTVGGNSRGPLVNVIGTGTNPGGG